jgi:FkbM family methyltransferase
MFDVGAHAGYTTLIAAQIVGTAGRVVAFEPNQLNRDLIARNLAANPDLGAQIRVEPYAVAAERGTAHFGGDETTGHLAESGERVPTISLDAYIGDTGVIPTLIKMDIEGGETRAFDGMAALLQARRPALIVEIHDEHAHARFARLVREHGYRVTGERAGSSLGEWTGERSIYLAD